MYKNDMSEAGFLDLSEEWETVPVTDCLESVLDEIECFLLRKWDIEGMGHVEMKTRMEDLLRRLKVEASRTSAPW